MSSEDNDHIAPSYNPSSTIMGLLAKFKHVDDMILQWESFTPSAQDVVSMRKTLHDVKKKALQIKLSFQDDAFYHDKGHTTNLRAVDTLLANIETAEKFLDSSQIDAQSMSIRRLTMVSTFCLPLSIITGFFGMNFAFMGIDPDSSGILRWKHAQLFLWTLLIFIILIVYMAFRYRLL